MSATRAVALSLVTYGLCAVLCVLMGALALAGWQIMHTLEQVNIAFGVL